jgi:tRNA (mo5U34)-methyltransferase
MSNGANSDPEFLSLARLAAQLHAWQLPEWQHQLVESSRNRLLPSSHGDYCRWQRAWQALPSAERTHFDARGNTVAVRGICADTNELKRQLLQFHPWRKGPFELFEVPIDTEWRSDLKWNRLRGHVDFQDKKILDIGCGNGYYGWRMLAAGANLVLGCDPFLLYLAQHEVIRRYAGETGSMHCIMPLTDQELPDGMHFFDITLSMGVLYHRSSPIDHLQKLKSTLRPGGQLVLETLILAPADGQVLVPQDRYAKMRNVWFIPSLPMLERWLERTGYSEIRVVDQTATTTAEQRSTEWMTFESLENFLDPIDSSRTLEGYPAPVRAIVTATV